MVKVSIILPVYNSEKNIQKTIDSVLNQTYKDYELIIVNDGSTDNTKNMCLEKQQENKNKIIYIEQENNGVSCARNCGINKAQGKYIMFIDSDDIYEKYMIEKMVEVLENTENELGVCGYNRINEKNGSKIEKNIQNMEMINDSDSYKMFIEKLQENNLFNQIWNKIYINDIIKRNNIKFDCKMSLSEDLKFNLEYIKYIKNAKYLNLVLYSYINSTSGLNLKYRKDRLDSNLEVYYIQKKLYIDKNFNIEYLDKRYIKICMSGLKNIVNNPEKSMRISEITKYIQNIEIKKELKEISGRVKGIKNKIIIKLLLSSNKIFIYFLAIILKKIDQIYKKIKLGY